MLVFSELCIFLHRGACSPLWDSPHSQCEMVHPRRSFTIVIGTWLEWPSPQSMNRESRGAGGNHIMVMLCRIHKHIKRTLLVQMGNLSSPTSHFHTAANPMLLGTHRAGRLPWFCSEATGIHRQTVFICLPQILVRETQFIIGKGSKTVRSLQALNVSLGKTRMFLSFSFQ